MGKVQRNFLQKKIRLFYSSDSLTPVGDEYMLQLYYLNVLNECLIMGKESIHFDQNALLLVQ